ncbi:MAG TPA: M1 family aminopeptidase [Terracidiphilus sp.]|nr:M1 family aminopeptidase [Terracidiphilus sp.]
MARAQRPANANSYYQQLRNLLPGGDVITVKDFELKREGAAFTFHSGSFAFYGEVNGKVTGAVFKGSGHLHVTPANAEERHNLSILTHSEEFDEDFDEAVLRFTDGTAAELHKASAGPGTADHNFTQQAEELNTLMRTKLQQNIHLRLLEDVLDPAPGGFFLAAIHGHKYSHLFFTIDPYGVPGVEPEGVALMSWNDWGPMFLTASNLSSDSTQRRPFRADHEDLDTTIEKGGFLTGLANVHIIALQDGVTVVPLDLYPTLRVSKVETDQGVALDYVQEKKEEDADFGVVLAQPLKKGEAVTLRVAYGGKEVVQSEGNANYYPVARESWYPNAGQEFGDYATYHMLFHVPKGLQLIATGTKTNETTEGKVTTTEWKSDVPLPVAGFNIGDFTMKEATVPNKMGDNLTVDAYANKQPPDMFNALADAINNAPLGGNDDAPQGAVGKLNTTGMLPVELSQSQVAAQIYTQYFGPLPFTHIAITQQFACNYGQSWPMLVYLPICGFLDSTQQHTLGLHPEDMYWKMVTPHEVAHQWWGHTVGFRSYRDQWMSEGFADESASIFLLMTRPKPNDYLDFWKEEHKMLTEKNSMGFRPIDVGPVTMGYRLNTEKTGWSVTRELIYPKGAYILHMVRMMMWDPREGDKQFIETMHDFVNTYKLRPATTEDFKAVIEKHMSPMMDMDGNHKMDWFFNEYVYGTNLPTYHFESQLTPDGDKTTLHFKLVQSGVPADFKMLVPLYLEFADGKTVRLGEIGVTGDKTVDQTVSLPKTPSPIKRALINYYYDVLSIEN